MIILHNRHDKQSRDFVEANGAGNIVIDWYDDGDCASFKRIAKHGAVSAFPSVVIHMPPHKILDVPKKGHHILVAKVKGMGDVRDKIIKINRHINKWAIEKYGTEGFLPDLTETDLHRSDNYWKNQLTA